MADAKWSVDKRRVSATLDGGTLALSVPVQDAGVDAGTIHLTLTPDRALEVVWEVAPGAVDPVDFRAWQKG